MSSEKGTTHDWELFPEKYATDASGNFLLKKMERLVRSLAEQTGS